MPKLKKTKKPLPAIETNGKKEAPTFEPTTIDQILGINPLSKYGTMDVETYESTLRQMPESDLRHHCGEMGVGYNGVWSLTIEKLVQQFKGYVAQFRKPKNTTATAPAAVPPHILKILQEGR